MKTAVAHHMRPTAVLFHEPDPWTGWTHNDYALLEAARAIEMETCPHCGNPYWLCHSDNPYIEWYDDSSRCYATMAKETRAFKKANKGKSPTAADRERWGKDVFTRPRMSGPEKDKGLPTRRDFYKAKQEEANQ